LTQDVGAKLRKLREENKLSQETLAESIGISPQQLHKYETGKNKISFDKLEIIAAKFGVDLNYFSSIDFDVNYATISKAERDVLDIFYQIKNKKLKEGWVHVGQEFMQLSENK